jgi:hypothetical protein
MSGLTIRAQLLLYFVLLVALQVGLSLFAIERLISIEAVVQVMNNRDLHGTRLLADIDDEKSDFLLAAASRTVARDEASAKADDGDADQAGQAIDRAGAEFLTLGFNENILGKFHTFRSAWHFRPTADSPAQGRRPDSEFGKERARPAGGARRPNRGTPGRGCPLRFDRRCPSRPVPRRLDRQSRADANFEAAFLDNRSPGRPRLRQARCRCT